MPALSNYESVQICEENEAGDAGTQLSEVCAISFNLDTLLSGGGDLASRQSDLTDLLYQVEC